MGLSRYYRPPTPEEQTWNSIIFSFFMVFLLSAFLIILFRSYEPSHLLSIILIGILWIVSLAWFIGSIKSKYMTKIELKEVFNVETIFNPIVLIFGILFGVLGGVVFAAIIEVLLGIKDYGVIFYFLWFIGFALIYAVLVIIASKSR